MIVGLIPARSGSKRVPNKNVRDFNGHPLMAYTICAALQSGVFDKVLVSTDSVQYADIARSYGADVLMRPESMATDTSPDIEWVAHALGRLPDYELFSILRPTSPFRQPETIRRGVALFQNAMNADSLRAVAPCGEHPGKMWTIVGTQLQPLLLQPKQPFHSSQKSTLPKVYTQTSGLEVAWSKTVFEKGSIAGEVIVPFIMEGAEAHDLNTPEDWVIAQWYLDKGAKLPDVKEVDSGGSYVRGWEDRVPSGKPVGCP